MTENLRMYAVVRTDLGDVPVGKLMGSVGHAFQMAFWLATLYRRIDAEGYANSPEHSKIVLAVGSEEELLRFHKSIFELAPLDGIPCHLVTDLAKTVFNKPTITCLGLGPITVGEYQKLNLKQYPLFK
jgi:peptidyl-tRNA hydrolase